MAVMVSNVAHAFGDRVALDGVTFDVRPGGLTGLLGPNGAGKTTLMGRRVRLREVLRRRPTT